MRTWVFQGPGEPREVLHLEERPDLEPGPGDVVLDVEAVGVAFPDLLLIRGEYQIPLPPGATPGGECVGRVRSVGAGTELRVGTRVLALCEIGRGALGEQAVTKEAFVTPLPEDASAGIAAALPINYLTSHLALHRRGNVRAGDVVVVHGGGGGIGSAAIQLARAAGARVIASELGPERTKLCLAYGAEVAIDVASDDIIAIVKEATGGRGADVIIDPVGGDVFDASYRCVAPEGRILIIGFTSGRIPELRLNQVLLRNFAVLGVNALFYKEQWSEFLAEIVELYAAGAVTPEVEGEYPLEALPDLCDRLQRREVQGKAVIRVR